jgi:hypothetical protein
MPEGVKGTGGRSAKRWYFHNKTIDDPKLPFVVEITSGFTIYYRMREGRDAGVLRRADTMIVPKLHHIVINILSYNIIATGLDLNGKVTYVVFRDGVLFTKYEQQKEEESADSKTDKAARTE